ncbi:PepSY domain-containing protein [Caenispirillum bisanense]|uniref:PepSY domain-containing protein n=1 Tax=Caenispirillum bisanense TaxID=414052 RepID=A0A286GK28_9PROT|nr:PepSY domain-containing protein [Caenispirillum bisanense]SOD95449.1 hypothetical protein SAMN05421508_104344 [Caenispirillum bisanense]
MIRKFAAATVAATLLALAPAAMAADLCAPTEGPRKTMEEVAAMLEGQGYDVRKMDTEDGCIEMKGMDKDGKRVEVYVHPVTAEVVKVKTQG